MARRVLTSVYKFVTDLIPEGQAPNGGDDVPTFRYSPDDDDQPLVAIVEAVAWVKSDDVRELEPLYHVVDADVVRELVTGSNEFTRSGGDAGDDESEVTFRYEGCEVTVDGDTIAVRRTEP